MPELRARRQELQAALDEVDREVSTKPCACGERSTLRRGPGLEEARHWPIVQHLWLEVAAEVYRLRDHFGDNPDNEGVLDRPSCTEELFHLCKRFDGLMRTLPLLDNALIIQLRLAEKEDAYVAENGKTTLEREEELIGRPGILISFHDTDRSQRGPRDE